MSLDIAFCNWSGWCDVDSPRYIEICSGYGGIGIAVERVFPGARAVAHVEIESYAVANLVSKMEEGKMVSCPVWTDLKTFDPFSVDFDILCAGYPCQPFSVAGKRKGTEDPRHLWPFIADIIRARHPGIVILENVRGHVRLGLSEVLTELRGIGYRVRAGIFSAAEVGAPHRRERVFIVGMLDDAGSIESGRLPGCKRKAVSETGETSEGLGNAENGRRNVATIANRAKPSRKVGRPNSLADSLLTGSQGHTWDESLRGESGRNGKNADGSACAGSLLDHADHHGFEKCPLPDREREAYSETTRTSRWPARPGEEQAEWEAPRTLGGKLNPAWVEQLLGLPKDWTRLHGEPEDAWREDRLRLCGNGVVPDTAELAIRTLLKKRCKT